MFSIKENFCWVIAFFAFLSSMQAQEVRTIDGSENNLANPEWGAHGTQILRLTDVNYVDGSGLINDEFMPNERRVSNVIFNQEGLINDFDSHSDYVWAFGQFLDHDISLVESNIAEDISIIVPNGDEVFPVGSTISLARSTAVEGTGVGADNPRQYSNEVTAYLDGSVVYGSSIERATWLRTNAGDGKLKTSEGDLLPWNTMSGEYNDDFDPTAPFMADDTRSGDKMFVAGDIRANENPLLLTIHTMFVREHNRLCDVFANQNPNWDGERLYQESRRMIGAYIQSITYEEWLPSIDIDIPEYTSYKPNVNPGINNVFSAAAFRMGHTLINSQIIRMNNDGEIISQGNLSLKDAFFRPLEILFAGGIEPYAKGMATQVQQEMDAKVIDDVRNFLFGNGTGGLDLAAINIARGRDRGLSDFNTIRDNFGLAKLNNWSDLTDDINEATLLQNLYGNVDNLDPWVGMLAEKHIEGSMFGDLVSIIIERQFQDLRDGDRFYYENDPALSESRKQMIKDTRLNDIIMRNCDIEVMQENVFSAMPHSDIPDGPDLVESHLEAAIYPNPVREGTQLKIFGQKEEAVTVRIFDNHGRLLYSASDNIVEGDNFLNLSMQTQDWRNGFYSLVITTEDKIKTLKFTIQ